MRAETREAFLYDMLGYLGERGYDDAEEVVSIDERTRYSGGCETCSFEYQVLEVQYRMVGGGHRTVEVDGSLGEILNSLLKA